MPWPWRLAQENVLIFSIGRSHEREHQFKWVGEIVEAKFRFYKLKSRADVNLKKLDDARKYSIGVTNQDITHQFLEHKEFAASKLDLASDSDRNIEKLLVGRMDVILSSISNIDAACEHDRTICDKLEPLMVVDELTTPMYMAFSAATSDAVVKRARKAYDAMRTDGTWTKIMSRVH
jgi:polar amino acid transport system substrate-binding protein